MMVVFESTGGVDLGGMNGGSGGSRNLDLHAPDSPTDSQRTTDGADSQQPTATQPPSPPPLQQQQQQRPLPMVSAVDPNLPQKSFPLGRPHVVQGPLHTTVQQHPLQPGSHGLSQVVTNGALGVLGGGTMTAAHRSVGASVGRNGDISEEGFRKDMRDLEELLSKLNPMAEEFVPSSLHNQSPRSGADGTSAYPLDFAAQHATGNGNSSANRNGGRRVSLLRFPHLL